MGFVVNRKGEKLHVDNPEGYDWEKVVLLNDDTILIDRWIVSLFKREMGCKVTDEDYVTDKLFEHEPTDDELIFFMAQNEIHRYSGYATIDKVKMIDFER